MRSPHESPLWYADDGPYMSQINEELRKRPAPEPTDQDRYYDGNEDAEDEPTPYVKDLWDDPEGLDL